MSETKYLNFEIMLMEADILKEELKKELKKDTPDEAYLDEIITFGAWGNEIYNLFFILAESGYAKGIKNLLEICHDFDPNIQNRYGSIALMEASYNGHSQVVEEILQHPKTDPNIQRADGSTALYFASMGGHSQVVQVLLKHPSIDPNIKRDNGFTALHFASYRGHSQAVEALLKHPNIDITIKNKDGETARDVAKPEIRKKFPQLKP